MPVSLNYERLVEGILVASEFKGKSEGNLEMSEIRDFLKKIYQIKKGKIGKVVVKFLEPLNFHQFMNQQD